MAGRSCRLASAMDHPIPRNGDRVRVLLDELAAPADAR